MYGYSVAVRPDGNAWLTGFLDGSANFGEGERAQTTLTNGEPNYGFLARYADAPPPLPSAATYWLAYP